MMFSFVVSNHIMSYCIHIVVSYRMFYRIYDIAFYHIREGRPHYGIAYSATLYCFTSYHTFLYATMVLSCIILYNIIVYIVS